MDDQNGYFNFLFQFGPHAAWNLWGASPAEWTDGPFGPLPAMIPQWVCPPVYASANVFRRRSDDQNYGLIWTECRRCLDSPGYYTGDHCAYGLHCRFCSSHVDIFRWQKPSPELRASELYQREYHHAPINHWMRQHDMEETARQAAFERSMALGGYTPPQDSTDTEERIRGLSD